MPRFALLAAALALLAACASVPVYAPATRAYGPGYSEQRIESDRYRVVYRAPGGADPALIERYALRRAAELTLEAGRDHFIVDHRALDSGGYDQGPRASVGVGGASFGRRSAFGMGVGIGFPLGGARESANAATLDIRLGRGPKPREANAYDARDVLSSAPPR